MVAVQIHIRRGIIDLSQWLGLSVCVCLCPFFCVFLFVCLCDSPFFEVRECIALVFIVETNCVVFVFRAAGLSTYWGSLGRPDLEGRRTKRFSTQRLSRLLDGGGGVTSNALGDPYDADAECRVAVGMLVSAEFVLLFFGSD